MILFDANWAGNLPMLVTQGKGMVLQYSCQNSDIVASFYHQI